MAKSQSHAKANKKPTVRYRELIKERPYDKERPASWLAKKHQLHAA
ncbi:hypothetical protein [Limosilactobacillus mucosae]